MFVALSASVALFSAMPTAQAVSAVPFDMGTCLVAEIEPVMSFCYTVLAAVYVGAAYNDHIEWSNAPAAKSRGWSWCRVSASHRGEWRRFALGVAILTVCFILIVAAGIAQAASGFAFIARGIGTSVAIPPMIGVGWTIRRACRTHRSPSHGRCSFCVPRDAAVTLLQHAMPMVAFSVVCLAYVATPPQFEGCPDFLKAGRDLESPFSQMPAGALWPAGFDPNSAAARQGVVRTLTDTAVLRLLAATISVTTSIVIILQAQDSTARLREREGQTASETLRRAIGFVSHGARGPLNAAVLSLALLRQVNDKQPLTAATEDEQADSRSGSPTLGGSEPRGLSASRERSRVGGDARVGPRAKQRLSKRATVAEVIRSPGRGAEPTAEDAALGVVGGGGLDDEVAELGAGSLNQAADSSQTSLLDRATLLRELRASIQDSKRQLDGLLLWEKTKGRTAVDAVPWGWARLDKVWRSRIRLAFRGVCESTGVTLRVATLSYGPRHDLWDDATTAATGSPPGSLKSGRPGSFGTPSHSGVSHPHGAFSQSDSRADGHPSVQPIPADCFSIFADHDRVLGVCNNAASYGLSRVSELQHGKVELRCTVIPDADLCLRMGGPAEHPDDADLSLLEGRWVREEHMTGRKQRQPGPAAGEGSVFGNLLGLNRRGSARTAALTDFGGSFTATTAGHTTQSTFGSSGKRGASTANGSVAPHPPASVVQTAASPATPSTLDGPPPVLAVLQIEARDNGPGISRRLLASGKLFQPFARLQSDDSGFQLGSTGLALAVVRAIVVDGMGGEVGLCSFASQPTRRGQDPASSRAESELNAASEVSEGFTKPQQSRDGVVVFARIPVWVRPVAAASQQEQAGGAAATAAPGMASSRAAATGESMVRVGTAGQLLGGVAGGPMGTAGSSRGAMVASDEVDQDPDDGLPGPVGASRTANPPSLTVDTGMLPRSYTHPRPLLATGSGGRGSGSAAATGAAAARAAAEASAAAISSAPGPASFAEPAAATATTASSAASVARDESAANAARGARRPRQPREARGRARRAAAASATSPSKARPLAGRLAFLCDDDSVSRHLMARLLQRKGMRCEEFDDGRRLMDRVEALLSSDEPLPDVLLVDGTMPVLDGQGVLEELLGLSERQSERARSLASVPVVMVTGDDSDAPKFSRLGAQATLMKPIEPTDFVSTLMEQCGVSLLE